MSVHEPSQRRLDLLVVEVGDAVEHFAQRAGRLAHLDHPDHHGRKDPPVVHRGRQRAALPDFSRNDVELARHVAVADGSAGDLERVDERDTAPQQRRQRPGQLRRRKPGGYAAGAGQAQQQPIERQRSAGTPPPDPGRRPRGGKQRQQRRPRGARDIGSGNDRPRRQGQLRAETVVEIGERRHDLQHDDRHDDQRQRKQHRRIDQGRQRLAAHRREQPGVVDVAPNDRLEAAALLSGRQRGDVDTGQRRPLCRKRGRQRVAAPYALVDIVERRPERRVVDTPPQNVERFDQRQAGLEQRRQLLIEENELAPPGSLPPAQLQCRPAERGTAPQGENEQALVLQPAPQLGLALRFVQALDDLSRRGSQPAAKLHRTGAPVWTRELRTTGALYWARVVSVRGRVYHGEDAVDVAHRFAVRGHAVEPADRAFARVVGGQPPTHPELIEEIAQITRTRVDVRGRVERILHVVALHRRRHELHEALRTAPRNGVGVIVRLHLDHRVEDFGVHAVPVGGGKHQAGIRPARRVRTGWLRRGRRRRLVGRGPCARLHGRLDAIDEPHVEQHFAAAVQRQGDGYLLRRGAPRSASRHRR